MILVDPLKTLLAGGFIDIFGGTVPTGPQEGIGSATLLCTLSSNYPTDSTTGLAFDTNADNGVMKKPTAAVWSGINVNASTVNGTFWRYRMSGDANTAAPTSGQYRLQGLIGLDGASSMQLASLGFTNGNVFVLDNFQLIIPAGE